MPEVKEQLREYWSRVMMAHPSPEANEIIARSGRVVVLPPDSAPRDGEDGATEASTVREAAAGKRSHGQAPVASRWPWPVRHLGTRLGGSTVRGPVAALASFLLLVVGAGVVISLLTIGSRDAASPAGPIADPAEVGTLWESAMNRGDLDGLLALYSLYGRDITWASNNEATLGEFLERRVVLNAQYELTECVGQDATVTCQWTSNDDVLDAAGMNRMSGSMTFAIDNGFIQLFDNEVSAESASDWERVRGFFDWVAENHPQSSAQVYGRGPEGDQLRSELISSWLALAVIEEWQSTMNRGDLEGLMTLYAEDASWVGSDRAAIRDFFGWRIGLNAQYQLTDCQVEGAIVTCQWTSTDEFFQAAGVESLEGSMSLTIQGGLVIEQVEGPAPSATSAAWDRVLGEFDEWVQATHPELYNQPEFAFHYTPEMAELELELVNEWVNAG